jgi:hypothetical protein
MEEHSPTQEQWFVLVAQAALEQEGQETEARGVQELYLYKR